MGNIRIINLALASVGTTVFLALFLWIVLAPGSFDQRTRDFAISKVEQKFDEQFGKAAESERMDKVASLAGRYSEELEGRIEALRSSLDAGAAEFIADVLAAACKLDCERREEAEQMVRAFFESAIARYGFALERVRSFIVGEYDDVMAELRRDLTIFSATSFFALFFAFLLSLFRGAAAKHLLPISVALSISTAIAAIWYLFGQDWVMTVIFSNYWGWTYSIMLGILSVFLIDIAANRARVTSYTFNAVSNVFGGALHFSPC